MALPLDLSAKDPGNRITGEVIQLLPDNTKPHRVIIPSFGPFFTETLVVRAVVQEQSLSSYPIASSVVLEKWRDYYPVLSYVEATSRSGKSVMAAIIISDVALRADITLEYQSLGGPAQLPLGVAQVDHSATDFHPTVQNYTQAFGISAEYAYYEPEVNRDNRIDGQDFVEALESAAAVFALPTQVHTPLGLLQHLSDTDNPHFEDKASIQLANAPNWAVASEADAVAGLSRDLYVTPKAAAAAVGSRDNVPEATAVTPGTAVLNLGLSSADATDDSKALTSAGLLNLKRSATPNAIRDLFENGRQQVNFQPLPITYPVMCLGATCFNFTDLLQAVEASLNMSNIQGSATRSCIWIPNDVPAPDLSVTPVSATFP